MEAELLLTFQVSGCLRLPGRLDAWASRTLSGSYPFKMRMAFVPSTSVSQCLNACGKVEGWLIWCAGC